MELQQWKRVDVKTIEITIIIKNNKIEKQLHGTDVECDNCLNSVSNIIITKPPVYQLKHGLKQFKQQPRQHTLTLTATNNN